MKTKLVILFLLFSPILMAQTTEEWTQQKKTRIKRLMEQIAANKVYIEFAQKGYWIVTNGLHTIRDIKNADFRLHLGHIDSLKLVNPKIRNSVRVADIIANQLRIIRNCDQAIRNIRESGQFTPDELDYCKKVFDNLLEEWSKDIGELLLVITNGRLSMSDDERVKRIEKLYLDMQEKSSFAASCSNEMNVLALQRLTEQTEINYSKRINP